MTVDLFVPKAIAPALANDFDNLVYACRHCDTSKGDLVLPPELHPGRTRYADHLVLRKSGHLAGRTSLGSLLVKCFHWNAVHLVTQRRQFHELTNRFRELQTLAATRNAPLPKALYEQINSLLSCYPNPIWGDFKDLSSLGFQIIAPGEIGQELNERLMENLHDNPEKVTELSGTLF